MADVQGPSQAQTHWVPAIREDPRWTPAFSTSRSPATTSSAVAPPPAEWEDSRGMATRVTSTRFVGRAAELAELSAALEASAAGTPSLALVAGESGVGKSRLAGELTRTARETGARVLSGDCVELGEGELPYAPLVGALRRIAREGDPAFDALPASQRADLASILPGLGSDAPEEAAAAEQVRVFEALLAVFDAMSEEQPLLVVIEDLHWADSSTRGFVQFLARTPLHRAHPGGRHLPLGRAAPPPPAATAARRAGTRPAGASGRARPAQPRRDGRAARGHPRQPRRPRSGCNASTRAARATRCSPRSCSPWDSTAAGRCRRRCATR